MALFFFGWIFTIALAPENGEEKFFIFLTNWGYLVWVANLIWSACSVTATYMYYYCLCKNRYKKKFDEKSHGRHSHELILDKKANGCCCYEEDHTSWHQKVQWVLHGIGGNAAIAVTLLFWGLLYDPQRADEFNFYGPVNFMTHGVNGMVAVFDIFFTGIPVHLFHFLYPTLFGAVYAGFTGVYFAFNGTNANNNPYIYSLIDYDRMPGAATGAVLSVMLVFIPMLHVIIYVLYLIRELMVYLSRKFCCKKCFDSDRYVGNNFEMVG